MMTDEEIVKASVRNANKEAKNTTAARVLEKGPLLFIAATSIAYGALTKGRLSDKTASAVKALAATSFIYGASKPVGMAVDSIMDTNTKENEPKQSEKHPFINAAVNIAALAGVTALAVKGTKTGSEKLAAKFAPTANSIKEGLTKKANALNSSKLGQLTDGISKKASEFASNHPKLAKFAEQAAFWTPFVALTGGSLSLANNVAAKRDEIAVSNINKLILCREFASAALETKDDKEA